MDSPRKGERWAEGFLVCSTGLHRPIKEDVASIITRAGGKYVSSFSKRCTHLVVECEDGAELSPKMQQAIRNYGRWKAIIVGVEWVRRCEEEQQAVSHKEHMPELMLSEIRRYQAAKSGNNSSTPTNSKPPAQDAAVQLPETTRKKGTNITLRNRRRPLATGQPELSRFGRESRSKAAQSQPGVENETQMPHVSTGIKKAREAAARQEALQREQGPPTTRQAFGELLVPNKPPHDKPTPAQQNAAARSPRALRHPPGGQVAESKAISEVPAYPGFLTTQLASFDLMQSLSNWRGAGSGEQPVPPREGLPTMTPPPRTTRLTPEIINPIGSVPCAGSQADFQLVMDGLAARKAADLLKSKRCPVTTAVPLQAFPARQEVAVCRLPAKRRVAARLGLACSSVSSFAASNIPSSSVPHGERTPQSMPAPSPSCSQSQSWLWRDRQSMEAALLPGQTPSQQHAEESSQPWASEACSPSADCMSDRLTKWSLKARTSRGQQHNSEAQSRPSETACGSSDRCPSPEAVLSGHGLGAGTQAETVAEREGTPKCRFTSGGQSSDGEDVGPGVRKRGAAGAQDDSGRQGPGCLMLDQSPAAEASSASEVCKSASLESACMESPGRGDRAEVCTAEEPREEEVQTLASDVPPQGVQAEPAGCFQGMVALLDPRLSAQEQAQAKALVEGGKGVTSDHSHLGSEVTHVVCHPETAASWLAMGANVVSPKWLERSLGLGFQEKCLHISLDTWKQLPREEGEVPRRYTDASLPQVKVEAETDSSGTESYLPRLCPLHLLSDILWAVSEPLESARLDQPSAEAPDLNILPEEHEAVESVLRELGPKEAPVGSELNRQDWEEVVLRGSSLTLLLPLGGHQGHCSHSVLVPSSGLTRHALLSGIARFYQEPVPEEEQSPDTSMDGDSSLNGDSRAARLGSCIHLDSLVRVSRTTGSCIYELCLSG